MAFSKEEGKTVKIDPTRKHGTSSNVAVPNDDLGRLHLQIDANGETEVDDVGKKGIPCYRKATNDLELLQRNSQPSFYY